MANVLLFLVLVHLQFCTNCAIRRDKKALIIRASATSESKLGNVSSRTNATMMHTLSMGRPMDHYDSCPGPEEGGAWAVFHELGDLSQIAGQHSELLFCFLRFDEWTGMGWLEEEWVWPTGNPLDMADDDDEQKKKIKEKTCYGITYGKPGIAIYEKSLGEQCFRGAKTVNGTTKKYFKGCIDKFYSLLSNITHFSLPKIDDGGLWLLPMIHMFKTCQPKWIGKNYLSISARTSQNCNAFATTILACPLRINKDLHLARDWVSMRGFTSNCKCEGAVHTYEEDPDDSVSNSSSSYEDEEPELIMDRRTDLFDDCEHSSDSSTSNFQSSDSSRMASSSEIPTSLSTHVAAEPVKGCYELINVLCNALGDGPLSLSAEWEWCRNYDPQPYDHGLWGMAAPLYMYVRYKSGCYCNDPEARDCQCKMGCDRRNDCGHVADQSHCTWSCKKGGEQSWVAHGFNEDWQPWQSPEFSPTTQKGTCKALKMDSGKPGYNLYYANEIARLSEKAFFFFVDQATLVERLEDLLSGFTSCVDPENEQDVAVRQEVLEQELESCLEVLRTGNASMGPSNAVLDDIVDAGMNAINVAVKSDRGKYMLQRYWDKLRRTLRDHVDSMMP